MLMRYCNGCGDFNKTYKTCCKRGFEPKLSEKTGEYIRPSGCKVKAKKAPSAAIRAKNAKARAVDAFQMWVRYRDNWTCVVCGKHIDPNEPGAKALMHAGHYISRKYASLLLDPINVHAQCKDCNGRQNWEGMDPRYTAYMIGKYGTEVLNYLARKQHEICKRGRVEWEQLADHWEQELAKMK